MCVYKKMKHMYSIVYKRETEKKTLTNFFFIIINAYPHFCTFMWLFMDKQNIIKDQQCKNIFPGLGDK